MNSQIEKAINEVTKLESWDIQSVLGAVNYLARQTAINTVVRLVPDTPPEGSGLDYFNEYDLKIKSPDIKKAASPIVGIANRMTEILNEHTDTMPSTYEQVLAFMTERPPSRDTFKREYDNRKKLGMRPGIPMAQFVDMEMATAVRRHNDLVAKGEIAINLLNGIEGTDEQAPEWMYEAIHNKILQKLEARWMKAEMRRTNPKIEKKDRDEAEANKRMIEGVITELGGKAPSFTAEMQIEDDLDLFNDAVMKGKLIIK
jgi:hypothetical protein